MARKTQAQHRPGLPCALAAALLLFSCGGIQPEESTSGARGAVPRGGDERVSVDPMIREVSASGPAASGSIGGDWLSPLPSARVQAGMVQGVNLKRDAHRAVMVPEKGLTIEVDAAPLGTEDDGRPLELRFEVSSAVPNGGENRGLWNPKSSGPSLLVQEEGTSSAEPRRITTRSRWKTVVVPLAGREATTVQVRFDKKIDPARPTWVGEPWVAFQDASSGSAPSMPTVLLITSDTHRADHVSILNPDSPVATPHIDAVAGEGAVFTNCFTSINNTNPSHIALMTGLHPRDTKIINNTTRLSREADTLAERFRGAGYQCYAALSAFHLFDQLSGLGQGFNRMNAEFGTERSGPETLNVATRWLNDAGDAPVFLWVHLFDVHSPYKVHEGIQEELLENRPDPYREDASLDVAPSLVPSWLRKTGVRDTSFVHAMYGGEVRYLDGHLGPFFRQPRVRDAILGFTADHGEGLGEQSTFWTHFGVLTSTIHVPLILRGPGVPAGRRIDAPVEMIDLGKTLLRMADVDDQGFPGDDVRDLFEGVPASEPRFALSAHGICASIESDGWLLQMFLKAAKNRSSGRLHEVGSIGFFRLSDDPRCEENVLLENFPRAMRMRDALERWLDAAVATGLNGSNKITPEQEAKLAELGYAGGVEAEAAMRWWAPEFTDLKWNANPWNLAFQGDGDPELLREHLEPDFGPLGPK
ncbi:MAG: sulfatase [Planctomycetota bacterium]